MIYRILHISNSNKTCNITSICLKFWTSMHDMFLRLCSKIQTNRRNIAGFIGVWNMQNMSATAENISTEINRDDFRRYDFRRYDFRRYDFRRYVFRRYDFRRYDLDVWPIDGNRTDGNRTDGKNTDGNRTDGNRDAFLWMLTKTALRRKALCACRAASNLCVFVHLIGQEFKTNAPNFVFRSLIGW